MDTNQFRVRKFCLLIAVGGAVALPGCDSKGAAESPEVKAKVAALVERSKQRLSYVAAGGFWLGDPGPLMNDQLKETGAVLGPEAKPTGNAPYTPDENNKPPRWVTLDAFSIQQLKVTYGDFDVYVAANGLPAHPPQDDKGPYNRMWRKARTGDDVPAGVTWPQAKAYCQWLGKVSGLPFDLPTEAQWEFAASNGRKTHFEPAPTDNGILELGRNHPNFDQKDEMRNGGDFLYPVGRFPGSKLKLHDLIGNGYEWTQDWYAKDAYATMQQTHNPAGPASGVEKVARGTTPNADIVWGFEHSARKPFPPEGMVVDGEVRAYMRQGFRCVVNQSIPVPGSYADGPGPVRNPLPGASKAN